MRLSIFIIAEHAAEIHSVFEALWHCKHDGDALLCAFAAHDRAQHGNEAGRCAREASEDGTERRRRQQ